MKHRLGLIAPFLIFFALAGISHAQSAAADASAGNDVVPDQISVVKAEVVAVESSSTQTLAGTDVAESVQTIRAKILEGAEAGTIVEVENDYLDLDAGEIFYLNITTSQFDGRTYYSVDQPYRLPQIAVLGAIFLVILFLFGGWQGLRGLLSLALSFLVIVYVLLPGILKGVSPVLMTFGVASIIIVLGSYITHGFNKTTSAAVLGMIATVALVGIFTSWAIHFARLSGFGTEEATYLNLNTRGSIDMLGLYFGGIMIGILGILYDIAIGQAVAVEEFFAIAPNVSKRKIYARAIRIGREHIGALVNTLAIAYVGVALPLLLLFYTSAGSDAANILNREIFSAEIVRTLMGSIGIILAVPITTLISIKLLGKKNQAADTALAEKEEEELKHLQHH